MSNKLAIIEAEAAEELDQLKVAIVDYDREVRGAFGRQMSYAFLAGAALLRAKEIIPHGKFMEWRDAELRLTDNSAARYMKFADAMLKFPTVGNLKEVRLLNRGDELTNEQQEKVARVVHKLADGKTLTEMYRDLGVIRQPEKPKHHPRKAGNAAVTHAEKKANSLDFTNAWRGPLRVWLTVQAEDDGEHLHLDRAEWEATLEILTEASAMVRARLKGGVL